MNVKEHEKVATPSFYWRHTLIETQLLSLLDLPLTVAFVCLCPSVPIIATVVQEELETGSASSGDASCAASTVKPAITQVL